jgi:hypothetical protein
MSSDAEDKPTPITRAELEGMSHQELAKVATKKRILAALPAEDVGDEDAGDEEGLTPHERMRRAILKEETGNGSS